MKYNFDEIVDRKNTHSIKVDCLPEGNSPDAISLWVADMDFPCADPIIEALHKRIDRKIFGYSLYNNDELKTAITSWFKRRFEWEIDKKDLFFSPGIVPAIALLIDLLTEKGDGIIIQRPVYYPFTVKIEANGRKVVNNSLIYQDGEYSIDFKDLEEKFAREDVKGLLFCSPHNPSGRVWTKDELKKIVEIAKKYDKWIISDEIHCDLTRIGIEHTPLAKIAPEYKHRIITCNAPSKTFNLAGMQLSNVIISNPEYKNLWMDKLDSKLTMNMPNPFAIVATIAAYNEGEEWLEQVRAYLDANIDFVKKYVTEHLPLAKVVKTEGTYLVWIDLRAYEKDPTKLEKLMQEKAKVALDEGYIFGEEGNGFERINVASSRVVIEEAVKRMVNAIKTIA